MGLPIYKAGESIGVIWGHVDKTYAGHQEPDITSLYINAIDLVAQFSVGWCKQYLDNTPSAFGIDFNGMISDKEATGVYAGGL